MTQPKALLVEDAAEFVVLCRRMLESEGFQVSVAGDGEQAVALARSERPDLLLLDITLPGIDGFEVCRRVREFTDAYVVMVTGRDDEVDKVVGLSVGPTTTSRSPSPRASSPPASARSADVRGRRRPPGCVTSVRCRSTRSRGRPPSGAPSWC